MTDANITERQQKWFASIRENLEKRTGKSLEQWVAIARTCPVTKPRAQIRWFKETHGLLQNSASYVLGEAFHWNMGWEDPGAARTALWTDPASTAILEAVEKVALALPDVVATQRKGYTAWSRKVQFLAVRPAKGGAAILGLAAPPASSNRLRPARHEGWSERLKATTDLSSPADVDAEIEVLIRKSWDGA